MPIFEFKCLHCNNSFEELVFGKQMPEKCPHCGDSRIEKCLSAFSFKSAGGEFSSSRSSGCSTCSSKNCSSCR